MEITGKITHILETESGEGKNGTWRKRSIVIESGDKYPKSVVIQQWNEAIDESTFGIGDTITAHINIESREYNGRWYTDVKAWKVDFEGGAKITTIYRQPNEVPFFNEDTDDDLPFIWLILPLLGTVGGMV